MIRQLYNNHGFAIVYALIVLVLASIGGTALLFLSRKDHINQSDYAGMRTATQAAVAALRACEGQFKNDPNTAKEILLGFKDNADQEWMLGSGPTMIEPKIPLWNSADAPSYSARIVNYDDENQIVHIEGIGYLNGGGKKRVMAMYSLGGIMMSQSMPTTKKAMYLGGALQNINTSIDITGDVYLKLRGGLTTQHFNNGGTINGNLKTDWTTSQFDVNKDLTINGNVFMRAPLKVQAVFTIGAGYKAGFEQTIDPLNNGPMELNGTSYFNCSYPTTWNSYVDMNGNKVYYYTGGNPDIPTTKLANASSRTARTSKMSLADSLGMTPGDEETDTVFVPQWGPGEVYNVVLENYPFNVSIDSVNKYWDAQEAAGKLWKDEWLIVKFTLPSWKNSLDWVGGGTFTKKAVWITDDYCFNVNGNWWDCSDESNTLIIINKSGFINGMGVPDNCNFRGYIYANTTSDNTSYLFGANSTLYGAINHFKGNFNLNSPGELKIDFGDGSLGQTAKQEFINLGLINGPGGSIYPPGLNLVDLRIRPKMISMQL